MNSDHCNIVHACSYTTETAEWLTGFPLLFLPFVVRVCWAAANVMYVHASWRHKSYRGVPISALYYFVPWLVVYKISNIPDMSATDAILSVICFVASVLQIMQYLKYNVSSEWSTFRNGTTQKERIVAFSQLFWNLELLIVMVGIFISFRTGFNDVTGTYGAFNMNTYMSSNFLWHLITKPSEADDTFATLWPGVLRGVGSFAASVLAWGQIDHNFDLVTQYLCIIIADAFFIMLSVILKMTSKKGDCEKLSNEVDCEYIPVVCTAVAADTPK